MGTASNLVLPSAVRKTVLVGGGPYHSLRTTLRGEAYEEKSKYYSEYSHRFIIGWCILGNL